MIISSEQVQRAVEYLRTPSGKVPATYATSGCGSVSPELLDRVRQVVDGCPDMRADRMEHAQVFIEGKGPSSSEVAEKMIGRIISDSLR